MALTDYDFDFKDMITQLLGPALRKPIRRAWLKASLKVVRDIHTAFISYTQAIRDEIIWNGQTIVLQRLLELKFGDGIFITNNMSALDGAFVGSGDDLTAYIGDGEDVSNFIDTDYIISAYNFTVHVPVSIIFSAVEMQGYVNKYKMFGTTYNIVTF